MSFGSSKSSSVQYFPGAKKLLKASVNQLGFPMLMRAMEEFEKPSPLTSEAQQFISGVLGGDYRRRLFGDVETLARNAAERFGEAANLTRSHAASAGQQAGMLWSTARQEAENELLRQTANDFNRFLSDLLARTGSEVTRAELQTAPVAMEMADPQFRRLLDLLGIYMRGGSSRTSQFNIGVPISVEKQL